MDYSVESEIQVNIMRYLSPSSSSLHIYDFHNRRGKSTYLFTAKTPLLYREEIIGPIPYQEIIYAHEIPFNVESGAEEEDLQIKDQALQ